MTIEELKETISKRTGMPVNILSGETEEEVFSRAKSILDFQQKDGQQPKPTNEQFSDYMHDIGFAEGERTKAPAEVLSDIEIELHPPYPQVSDGGEVAIPPTSKTNKELFSDFFVNQYGNGFNAWN